MKPAELTECEVVDGIARRYGVLPSAVLAEDVSVLRRLAIVKAGEKGE